MPEHVDLRRLVTAAHEATRHIAPEVDAQQLYTEASSVAEQAIPGPVGTAVAGVLAIAAESRRVRRLRGSLGESQPMLALALAVLDAQLDQTGATDAD